MRVPILRGRSFDEHDTVDAPKVAIINETMALALFPGQDPIGHELRLNGPTRIVGVAHDVRHSALDQQAGFEVYFVCSQGDCESPELVVRTSLKPEALAGGLRKTIWSFAPSQPIAEFRTMDEVVEKAASPRRFTMVLLGIFAALALLLAVAGIYGVIAYSVEQRTREIGIRMALGARALQIRWEVVREAALLTLIGAAIGVAGVLLLSRYMKSLLYQVTGADPVVLGTVAVLVIAVGAAAAFVPARKASLIDPVEALRLD
jgi:predicted permease